MFLSSSSPEPGLNEHRCRGVLFPTGVLVSYQRNEALALDWFCHAHEELSRLLLLTLHSEDSPSSQPDSADGVGGATRDEPRLCVGDRVVLGARGVQIL